MAKYKKKPVVIDAEVYREGLEDGWKVYYTDEFGDHEKVFKTKAAANQYIITAPVRYSSSEWDEVVFETPVPIIKTLEGIHDIKDGDYIITGVKSERYPCKPDIFEMTYELV